MAVLENKGKLGVTHLFSAKQGNRTMVTGREISGKRTLATYTNEILKGDCVKLVGENTVEKCSAGDADAIGVAMDDFDHVGAYPSESATWGNYDNNCIVKVETFARKILRTRLEATNSKIVAGDYLTVGSTTVGSFDKSNDETNVIALENADANSGAIINAMYGFIKL